VFHPDPSLSSGKPNSPIEEYSDYATVVIHHRQCIGCHKSRELVSNVKQYFLRNQTTDTKSRNQLSNGNIGVGAVLVGPVETSVREPLIPLELRRGSIN